MLDLIPPEILFHILEFVIDIKLIRKRKLVPLDFITRKNLNIEERKFLINKKRYGNWTWIQEERKARLPYSLVCKTWKFIIYNICDKIERNSETTIDDIDFCIHDNKIIKCFNDEKHHQYYCSLDDCWIYHKKIFEIIWNLKNSEKKVYYDIFIFKDSDITRKVKNILRVNSSLRDFHPNYDYNIRILRWLTIKCNNGIQRRVFIKLQKC